MPCTSTHTETILHPYHMNLATLPSPQVYGLHAKTYSSNAVTATYAAAVTCAAFTDGGCRCNRQSINGGVKYLQQQHTASDVSLKTGAIDTAIFAVAT